MSFLNAISQILLLSFAIGFGFWSFKYIISFYLFSRKKEEINRLNARISILKLHLRSKIKKKSHKIEEVLRKDNDTLSLAQPHLNKICELNFQEPSDYQKLITELSSITTIITNHIRLKHKNLLRTEILIDTQNNDTLAAQDEVRESCKKLVKYDKAHMTIIVEIILSTQDLINKIEDFNMLAEYESGQKKITDIPVKVEIENFEIIHSLVEQAKHSEIDVPDFPILEKNIFDDVG